MNWAKTIIILYFIIDTVGVIIYAARRTTLRYNTRAAILVLVTHVALIAWVANA